MLEDLGNLLKNDSSGKMSKESYVKYHYPDHYLAILNFCKENGLNDLPFKEKVYLSYHGITTQPKCKREDCKNFTKYKNSTLGYISYCSTKCISSDPNIKDKKINRSIEKWGTKTPSESQVIRNKIIQTNQTKWGGNSPMSSDVVKNKSKETLIKNWGVDNPSKNRDILDKRVESFKENIQIWKESYKKTSIERWGTEHPWSNPEVHKKTITEFYKNYRDRIEEKINPSDYTFLGFDKDTDTTSLHFGCNKCSKNFNILTYQFYTRIKNSTPICTICHPIGETSSLKQEELLKIFQENFDSEVLMNDKSVIYPKELDFYLPDLKIAFEFNGVFWHSSRFKAKDYHLEKMKVCEELGIKLYTIWEDDYLTKQDIVKSFILNKLKRPTTRIWARKCQIKEVPYLESKKFLEDNHLQGDCKSSVRLGLYYEGELISLMCFSKIRLPISRKGGEGIWELTRFCNKNYVSCPGGASKLLKHFKNNYSWIQIQTYSDNMISQGELYETLGFDYSGQSQPGYWYVVNGIRKHRFNYRKHLLVKKGADPSKTEEQITQELGYSRVWNCGNRKWILNK